MRLCSPVTPNSHGTSATLRAKRYTHRAYIPEDCSRYRTCLLSPMTPTDITAWIAHVKKTAAKIAPLNDCSVGWSYVSLTRCLVMLSPNRREHRITTKFRVRL
eukprot:2833328-Rhodomonas_salina.2